MKKLLLIAISLIIIVMGILGFAFLNANKLIAQFKPQLEQIVSKTIGAQIEFTNITASVLPQTALKVSGLSIKNASGDKVSEAGPSFNEFLLKLNLKSLLSGKLDITEITLTDPKLYAIKGPSGISIRGLPFGNASASGSSTPSPSQDSTAKKTEGLAPTLPVSIDLKSFALKNGEIHFEDKMSSQVYKITNLNISSALDLEAGNVSLNNLNLDAKLLEDLPLRVTAPVITLNGKDLNVASLQANLGNLSNEISAAINIASQSGNLTYKSSELKLEDLSTIAARFAPIVTQFDLKGSASPNIKVKIESPTSFEVSGNLGLANIGAKQGMFVVSNLGGNIDIKATGPTNAQATSENLKLTLNDQAIDLKFSSKLIDKTLNIENFVLQLLGGSLSGNAALNIDDSKSFNAKINAASLSIEKALAVIHQQATNITGIINKLDLSLNGNLGPNLKESLRGNANVLLSDGQLKGWNLAGIVLKAVNNLPFLTGALYSSVPASSKGSVDSTDTAFSSITTSVAFEGNGIGVKSLNLMAPVYTLEAKGNLGFDTSLDLSSTIYFNSNFSTALVSQVPKLKTILDDKDQLVFPLKLQGKPPAVLVYPNLQKLLEVAGKRLLIEKGNDIVKGLLDKKGLGGILGF